MNLQALGFCSLLFLLVIAWSIGCRTSPAPPTTPGPTSDSEIESERISLLCERAIFATAQARIAECPACWEDFQSAYDVLDFLLDQPVIERQDLVNALACTKLQRFEGPDGLVLVTADNVFIQLQEVLKNRQDIDVAIVTLAETPITPEMIEPVAMACWVGLNKWRAIKSE